MDKETPRLASRLLFDPQDYEMLRIVNDVLARGRYTGLKRILAPYLHPNGIKQMAATRGLRIAYAVVHLLGSLERGKAPDRIDALRSLKSEVLMASESTLSINTARVLMQIMKELVRSKDDPLRQLELAHDFRRAIVGKPRVIRNELRKYHLIEVPEDWSQLSFDDHVHDANTKGRKSPTHLIMDAWIKGIRKLTVIYYSTVEPDVAAELIEAAEIMGLSARICIELRVRYQDRFVKLLWRPRNLSNQKDCHDFLHEPGMVEFRQKGRDVLDYQRKYVQAVLDKYNQTLRRKIGASFGIQLKEISWQEFLAFVGVGQPSLFHLGNMISTMANLALTESSGEPAGTIETEDIDAEHIIDTWLAPRHNPEILDPFAPHYGPDVPELLTYSTSQMVELISSLHNKNWITLELDGLDAEDVLILLHHCGGGITHLEIFNLLHYEQGRPADYASILEVQSVVNSANLVLLKKYLRRIMERIEAEEAPFRQEKLNELQDLLENLSSFHELYKDQPLRSCIGSDSTGQSQRRHGMGLIVAETLPPRAQHMLKRSKGESYLPLPVAMDIIGKVELTYRPPSGLSLPFAKLMRMASGFFTHGDKLMTKWKRVGYRLARRKKANIYTLGGIQTPTAGAMPTAPTTRKRRVNPWANMNSHLKNFLKILIGFVPASLSFYLTKDWWLLAYFGPVIWFGITGVRNIIQSVLACGGLHRTSLIKWNDFVSWERLSDSLLYTGFSVPLLDYLVKTVLLDHGLGITTQTNAIELYTIMALVNGAYISTHNILRGLPRRAVVGNFFRSVLSIPLAVFYNIILSSLLGAYGVPNVDSVLQKWAAIISKFASDCVAGVIEGMADRATYIRLRTRDLKSKMEQILKTYARLEVLFPQDDVLELLQSPKAFIETISTEQTDLEKVVIVNALDIMYFWLHQPQTRTVLRRMLRGMDQDERKAFLMSQYVLQREKEISLLLLNGLLGRKFNSPLAFYLDNFENYLIQIQHTASRP